MQYSSGKVNVTNGSSTVTGVGTEWVGAVSVGDAFTVEGHGSVYWVASITSNTQLTLSAPYAGPTQSNVGYTITRDFTVNYRLPEIGIGDLNYPLYLTQALRQIDSLFVKASDVTNGYVPYFVSSGRKFVNSPVYTDGTRVGIGVTSLTQKLEVAGNVGLKAGGEAFIGTLDNYALSLRTNNVDIVYVTNDGKVGIGTTSPSQKLTVSGNIGFQAGANAFIGTLDNYDLTLRTNDVDRVHVTKEGNVGIGVSASEVKLTVSGVIKAGGNYYNVVTWYYNNHIQNGVKIKTNIPYSNGSQMPTIIIEGYSYYPESTIGIALVWYVYYGIFISYRASSWGGIAPTIVLSNENGLVSIWLNWKPFYGRMTVRAYAYGIAEQPSWFQGWSVVDEVVGGSNQATVPYVNTFSGTVNFANGVWSSNGNVGIGTTSPSNILTVVQNSTTDPIADSWTVYSTSKTKKILNEVEKFDALMAEFDSCPVHKWVRTTEEPGQEEEKKPYKQTIPRYSMVAEEAPEHVRSYDSEGNLVGLDLLSYIGWLHAIVKGLKEEIKKIKEEIRGEWR